MSETNDSCFDHSNFYLEEKELTYKENALRQFLNENVFASIVESEAPTHWQLFTAPQVLREPVFTLP